MDNPELLAQAYQRGDGAWVAVLSVYCNDPETIGEGSYQIAEEIPCADKQSAEGIVDLMVEGKGAHRV